MTGLESEVWSVAAARAEVLGCVPSCSGTDGDSWFARNIPEVRRCIRICAACPVRTSCLAGALARGEEFGVWGGIRFKPAWAEAWVVPRQTGHAVNGRAVDGGFVRLPLLNSGRVQAEEWARKLVYRGRRRAFVARWVRRVGRPVPGGWWIGPWTEPDPDLRVELMRPLVPSLLRDRPVASWPWELRMLAEFPASAIPQVAKNRRPRTDDDHQQADRDNHGRLDSVGDHDQIPVTPDRRAA